MSRSALAADDGFTLVELLVTMAISVIVLLAILGSFDSFFSSQKASTDAIAAQERARSEVRGMVSTLREARVATGQTSPIPAAFTPTRSDLVVSAYVTTTAGTSVPGWVRYCAATSGGYSSLIIGTRAIDAYAAPGTCAAGNTVGGWTHRAAVDRTLLQPTQLFNYTSSTCAGASCLPAAAAVRSVGVRVAIARSRGATTLGSLVRDAVSFRNRTP